MATEQSASGQLGAGVGCEVLAPEPIARLREIGALGMDVPCRIIRLFLEDAPVRLANLSESLTNDDPEAMERDAHSLRGSSANLGAAAFARLCHEVEQLAGGATLAGARDRLEDLEAEFARVEEALRELLAELGSQ